MTFTAELSRFRYASDKRIGVADRRVLVTGAGKDGGFGQALALAAGLMGAASVGVHFHRSYADAFDLVDRLRAEGVNAFPVQADVTNMGDVWATRPYIIEQMGGPPDLVVCNSGLSEKGYSFGKRCGRSKVSLRRCGERACASTSSTTSRNRGSSSIPRSMGFSR